MFKFVSKIFIFGVLSALSACCSPSECRTATRTFEKLEPIAEGIIRYQETTGSAPEHLEDAFPDGLPDGIYDVLPAGETDIAYAPASFLISLGQYYFQSKSGAWVKVEYGRSYTPETAPFVYFLAFGYVGPGYNRCTWTTARKDWTCSGYY